MGSLLTGAALGFGLGVFVALPYLLGWGHNTPVLWLALKSMLPRLLKKHASRPVP